MLKQIYYAISALAVCMLLMLLLNFIVLVGLGKLDFAIRGAIRMYRKCGNINCANRY